MPHESGALLQCSELAAHLQSNPGIRDEKRSKALTRFYSGLNMETSIPSEIEFSRTSNSAAKQGQTEHDFGGTYIAPKGERFPRGPRATS